MKRSILALALGVAMSSAMADKAADEKEIIGELVSINGATYLIKDMTGTEHALHVDDTTKKEGSIAIGAKVEAYVTPENHVTKLTLDE